ncbi:hypothetical protein Cgig2_023773 [Carnegiea gigantea]|uniref:Uncharacterized protein n=1 Tax=Carnegiea gigantea TaxID=171969 RepID=A0A9Q1GHR1_9CARY|nr:hypothetical protein Cgig2_023773 [Carnegiea gigantea]
MAGTKASSLLKKIMAGWSSKRNELRVCIMVFFLLHKNMDKTSLAHSFSHSLQALVSHPHHHPKKKYNEEESQAYQLMYYNKVDGKAAIKEEAAAAKEVIKCQWGPKVVKEVMEMEQENVDKAADMFIKRFKREIELQKQQSLDSHQMLLLSNS